jgi:tetratricopeptide (TPR) repeat protein
MAMIYRDVEPYLTAASTALSIATFGFLLNLIRAVRDNAQDQMNVMREKFSLLEMQKADVKEHADREKARLTEQLDQAKAQMDTLLNSQGIDLTNLTLGMQLSETASEVRRAAAQIIQEMQGNLAALSQLKAPLEPTERGEWELSLAMGAMASGAYEQAAEHLDTYAQSDGQSWLVNFTRGVAHANARGGIASDLAALRAYNEAIALAPTTLEPNRKARLFSYRAAILKRLNRLAEAEGDLRIAQPLAEARHEHTDIHYNLACIHAMRGEKEQMLRELRAIEGNGKYMALVRSHFKDYFAKFRHDDELIGMVSKCHFDLDIGNIIIGSPDAE